MLDVLFIGLGSPNFPALNQYLSSLGSITPEYGTVYPASVMEEIEPCVQYSNCTNPNPF